MLMNLDLIKEYIKKCLRVTVAEVQYKFALSYGETRNLFAQLESEGYIVKVSELFYDWAYKDMPGIFDGIESKHLYLQALRYCIDTNNIDIDRVCKYCQIRLIEANKIFAWMMRNRFISDDCKTLFLSKKEFVKRFGDVFALYHTYNSDGQPIYDDDDEDKVWEEITLTGNGDVEEDERRLIQRIVEMDKRAIENAGGNVFAKQIELLEEFNQEESRGLQSDGLPSDEFCIKALWFCLNNSYLVSHFSIARKFDVGLICAYEAVEWMKENGFVSSRNTLTITKDEFVARFGTDLTYETVNTEVEARQNALQALAIVMEKATKKVLDDKYTPIIEEMANTDGEIIVSLRDGDVRELPFRYRIKKSALGKFAELKFDVSMLRQVCRVRSCDEKLLRLLVRKYPKITKGQMMTKLNDLLPIAENCGNWRINHAVKRLHTQISQLTVDQFDTKRRLILFNAKRKK